MRRLFTPSLRICFGLVSLTLSLVLIAHAFGLLPNEDKAALEARAKISEALAIQLAVAAGHKDITVIKETISLVLERNRDVLSVAIRRADGEIIVQAGNHDSHWLEPADGRSTADHVLIPLNKADSNWGRIEIVFKPLATSNYALGLSKKLMEFIGFISIAGFAGYFIILKRTLRELDPSGVIPERVQAAFDTLAEGVVILDEQGLVLLANKSFAASVGASSASLFATKVSALPWLQFDAAFLTENLPWQIAMRDKKAVTGVLMGLRTSSAKVRRLMVNATHIVDGKDTVRGVIATFYDFTELHEKNEQLKSSINQLHETQTQVEEQNRQLRFLASHDPLTGCLNRRSFFAELERSFESARSKHQSIFVLMLDLDHFKRINDRFGHAVGDKVLVSFAEILRRSCRERDYVGRYGGEEFCIVISLPSVDVIKRFSERMCHEVAAASRNWLPNGEPVTVSIGIASAGDASNSATDVVARADRALYAAKAAGRNGFVYWEEMSADLRDDVSQFKSELGEAAVAKYLGSDAKRKGINAA